MLELFKAHLFDAAGCAQDSDPVVTDDPWIESLVQVTPYERLVARKAMTQYEVSCSFCKQPALVCQSSAGLMG